MKANAEWSPMGNMTRRLARGLPRPAASLKVKVPVLVTGATLTMLCALAFVSFQSARTILVDGIEARFASVLQARADDLTDWFGGKAHDLRVQTGNTAVQDALFEFDSIWVKDREDTRAQLIADYITANPHPAQDRHRLEAGEGHKTYARSHGHYHPELKKLTSEGGYDDMYLVSLEGDVIYSVRKGADFAANLAEGPLAESGLGRAWRAAVGNGGIAFEDFAPYEPAGGPAGFFAAPVTSLGSMIGVAVFRAGPAALSGVLSRGQQPGEALRTRLVGRDGRTRPT